MLLHDSADIILEVKRHTWLQIHCVYKRHYFILCFLTKGSKCSTLQTYLEMKVTFIHCLIHKAQPQQGALTSMKVSVRMATFILKHSLNSVRQDYFKCTSWGTSQSSLLGCCVLFHSLSGWYHTGNYEQALGRLVHVFPSRFVLPAVAVCLSVLPIGCFPNGESKFGLNVDSSLLRTRWHWFSLYFLCNLA